MPRRRTILVLTTLFVCLATAADARVSGRVTDLNLSPLAGARVAVQGTEQWTITAADGRFTLPDAAGSGLVVVAVKKGYFNGSTTIPAPGAGALIALHPVPQDDDPSYDFVDPASCGGCHPDQLAEWLGSPMADAGINTWSLDLYDGSGTAGGLGGFVYTRDSILAPHNPASECSSCHQPELWVAAPFTAMEPVTSTLPGVTRGVSCDVCHKIADVDESGVNYPGIYPGIVTFTRPSGPSYHQVQYGLLGDVDYTSPTLMRASYQPQLAAEVCAACHQDTNDLDEDGDFEEPNAVISEPTYLEWKASDYANPSSEHFATCVDCHMKPSIGSEVCSVIPPIPRDPNRIRSHRMEGTTPEYLENAATLAMDSRIEGNELVVDVDVINDQTGHHLPTGVTVRNVILLVEAWREEDSSTLAYTGAQTVSNLGGVGDPAEGYYAGLPGKLFAKLIEDGNGNAPTFYTEATGIVYDNRIPALATDSSEYRFSVPVGDGTLKARARLVYRRSFRALVDAKQWTTDGHGNPLEDIAPPHFGHLMESDEQTVLAVSCIGEPLGASCSDGNPCNGVETCDGNGSCVAGTPLPCNDGNACTDDACAHGIGCVYVANTAPCDDGDVCTQDDACNAGACVGASPTDCDDHNACTADSCATGIGCQHAAVAGGCEDGDPCTFGDVCSAGTCVPGARQTCDDGDPCTLDVCDELVGCRFPEEPRTDCALAASASLKIGRSEDGTGNRLNWKWTRGDTVAHADLGAPDQTTGYTLCIYDRSAGYSSLATRLSVAPSSLWRERDPRGWGYSDSSASQDGVVKIALRAAEAGRAAVKLAAKGASTPLAPPVSSLAMFVQDPSLSVQLVADGAPQCWRADFSTAATKDGPSSRFKAKWK